MTTDSRAPEATRLLSELEQLARERLGWSGRLERSMRLVEDLELDSLKNLALAIEIENHFRIVLDEDEEEAVATVGELVDLIERKVAGAPAGRD